MRAALRILPTGAGHEGLGRLDHRWLRCRRLKRRTRGGEPGTLVAVGEQPLVAQALKAARQDLAQEACDELVGRQADHAYAAGFVVAHPKAYLARIAGYPPRPYGRYPDRMLTGRTWPD